MSTEDTAAPQAVFARLIAGISAGEWAGLADLYAPDAVVRQPFAPPGGMAAARIEGRDSIRAHFVQGSRLPLELRARNVVVHRTDDPEVIIAEFDYHGPVPGGDVRFSVANIQVLRVRDGLIVETRDYHDHLALAAALAPPA